MTTKKLSVIAIVSSWLSLLFFNINVFYSAVAIWSVICLFTFFTKKYQLTRLMIALSAFTLLPSWNVTKAIYDYSEGIAVTHAPSDRFSTTIEARNLKADTRLFTLIEGDRERNGLHWRDILVNPSYDYMATTMVKYFGYQKGAYDGVYLSAMEAETLIEKMGETIDYQYNRRLINFNYKDKPYSLSMHFNILNFRGFREGTAKVYMLNKELLLFQPQNNNTEIYLADAKTMQIFAIFH